RGRYRSPRRGRQPDLGASGEASARAGWAAYDRSSGGISMKRSRGIAITATALTVASLAGVAAGTGGAKPPQAGDLATGSALNQFPTPAGPGFSRLSVAAHSDASGLHPRGNVHAKGTTGLPNGEFRVSGPVTCLRVDGNRAAIKYRFNQA